MVRFVAYFLSGAAEGAEEDYGLRFQSLLEFDVQESYDTESVDGGDEDAAQVAGGMAA